MVQDQRILCERSYVDPQLSQILEREYIYKIEYSTRLLMTGDLLRPKIFDSFRSTERSHVLTITIT